MQVRLAATPRDAALASQLVNEYADWLMDVAGISEHELPPALRVEIDGPFEHYARQDGAILLAGTLGLVALRPDGEGGAEVKRMFVRPAARGTGAGSGLLEAAIANARRRGYSRLWLETSPLVMGVAHGMYAAAGFREIPSRKLPGMPDHVIGMELELDAVAERAA